MPCPVVRAMTKCVKHSMHWCCSKNAHFVWETWCRQEMLRFFKTRTPRFYVHGAWHGCHYIPIRLIAISNVCPSKKDLNVLGRGQEKYASGDYINCHEHHLLFSVIHGNMRDVVTCTFNGDKFLTTGKLWWQWWKSSFTCLQGSQSSKLTSTQFISCRLWVI